MNGDTPLSDAITALSKDNSLIHTQFKETLLAVDVGIHVSQMSTNAAGGEAIKTPTEQQVQISSGDDGKGNQTLIAFADPAVFTKNFGKKFKEDFGLECNATLQGEALIRTALNNKECHGIRLTSAVSDTSLVLSRETLEFLLKGAAT
ncbi:MAG: hypothetical protein AB8G18_17725 [Gammaproteobacteria bacterium]